MLCLANFSQLVLGLGLAFDSKNLPNKARFLDQKLGLRVLRDRAISFDENQFLCVISYGDDNDESV